MSIGKSINTPVLNEYAAKQFIEKHGVDAYDLCLCGSGLKYKFCCMNNPMMINARNELMSWNSGIDKDIWGQIDISNPTCCYSNCTQESIRSHTIQESRYLDMIEKANAPVCRYVYMFKNGERQPFLRDEGKKQATTFFGFCSYHDKRIFSIIEGQNTMDFSKEQQYALVYRSLAFMNNKLYRINNLQINEHFKNMPKIYKNKVFKKHMLDKQVKFINDYRSRVKHLNNIKSYMNLIEQNYDESKNEWAIVDDLLYISCIRRVKISKPSFVFHTTRVMRDRDNPKYHTGGLDYLDAEKDNYLTTIVLPDETTSEQVIFFAAKKTADKKITVDFFNLVKAISDDELKNVVNNIMLDAYEEFYFSKEYYNNFLDKEEQKILRNNVVNHCSENYPILDLQNITKDSELNLFK